MGPSCIVVVFSFACGALAHCLTEPSDTMVFFSSILAFADSILLSDAGHQRLWWVAHTMMRHACAGPHLIRCTCIISSLPLWQLGLLHSATWPAQPSNPENRPPQGTASAPRRWKTR